MSPRLAASPSARMAELFCAALEKLWADIQPRDAASPEAFRRREARTLFSCLPPEPARDEPPESLWSLSIPADSSPLEILLAVADRLPQTQRFLFLLRFAADFSEQDAAFAVGGETSAAEGLCRKAEQTVKRQLSLLRFKVGLPDAPEAKEIGPLLREAAARLPSPTSWTPRPRQSCCAPPVRRSCIPSRSPRSSASSSPPRSGSRGRSPPPTGRRLCRRKLSAGRSCRRRHPRTRKARRSCRRRLRLRPRRKARPRRTPPDRLSLLSPYRAGRGRRPPQGSPPP